MAANTPTITGSLGGQGLPLMEQELLRAATSGDSVSMQAMASQDRNILLGATLQGNTCLHISSIYGHKAFCKAVLQLEESLLTAINMEGETPLVVAVTNGYASLASHLLNRCSQQGLRLTILQQDMEGFNALHHAIRCGHTDLALELVRVEPALSQAVSRRNESPMFFAAVRNSTHVLEALLNIKDSSHTGMLGGNALHAVVRAGYTECAKIIMEKRPEMARRIDERKRSPLIQAVIINQTGVLQVMLQHDSSLGYEVSRHKGYPLLVTAAIRGHVECAEEILKHCPDAPYRTADGWTCLHAATFNEKARFVRFIVRRAPQLAKTINMQDKNGKTALHYATQKCNPRIVLSLLLGGIDVTVQDEVGNSAVWELSNTKDGSKTLNWNKVCMLMTRDGPQSATILHNLQREAKRKTTKKSKRDAKSLTQTYTTNTSLVVILITTITFAAAFTLPGGYSSAAGSEGLPVMARKAAFQAFLISDTLAMCSSFAVAFICIIARWEDYKFLIYYKSLTTKLMWFAYTATTTAFSTGLYVVLAPRLHWLAIAICAFIALLPILTKVLGQWHAYKLRERYGMRFKSDLLHMV